MATAHDACTVITAALTEIGMTGKVEVEMYGARSVQVFGELDGDDVWVAVTVIPARDALPTA